MLPLSTSLSYIQTDVPTLGASNNSFLRYLIGTQAIGAPFSRFSGPHNCR